MRVVQRKHTFSRTEQAPRLNMRSTDYDVAKGVDTLRTRFRAVKDGESLYPWSNTKLHIANGKRRWVAKQPEDYYHE